jgi:hypothetical protein
VATNLSSFRPSPASGKEVAVTLFRRTYGGQEESSQKGSSQEEGSQEEDREEEVARLLMLARVAGTSLPNRSPSAINSSSAKKQRAPRVQPI